MSRLSKQRLPRINRRQRDRRHTLAPELPDIRNDREGQTRVNVQALKDKLSLLQAKVLKLRIEADKEDPDLVRHDYIKSKKSDTRYISFTSRSGTSHFYPREENLISFSRRKTLVPPNAILPPSDSPKTHRSEVNAQFGQFISESKKIKNASGISSSFYETIKFPSSKLPSVFSKPPLNEDSTPIETKTAMNCELTVQDISYISNSPPPIQVDATGTFHFIVSTAKFPPSINPLTFKAHFFSENSYFLFLYLFWYFYCQYFQENSAEDQYLLLYTASEHFGKLSNRIKTAFKGLVPVDSVGSASRLDSFYQFFYVCLAQAINFSFLRAFPGSSFQFYEMNLREQILLDITCLTCGVTSSPTTLRKQLETVFPQGIPTDALFRLQASSRPNSADSVSNLFTEPNPVLRSMNPHSLPKPFLQDIAKSRKQRSPNISFHSITSLLKDKNEPAISPLMLHFLASHAIHLPSKGVRQQSINIF